MISQAQAIAVADRWLNPSGADRPQRRVGIHEFDLGWVVWAVPPPPERDPVTGERRPPAEVGNACGVVDRRTGELSVWPSVPVEEIVRMYRLKHQGSHAQTQPSVTGPGNTTVITYVDPANGEETSLFRNSAPGMPHSESQAYAELQRMGVPARNVLAVHTDLSSSRLPGGYPGVMLQGAFPQAQFSCTQQYGPGAAERAEAVAALVQHVETMHRIAGQQPPPAPHRAPVPSDVTPAAPVPDAELHALLVQAFGEGGVLRHDPAAVAGTPLPADAKSTLTEAGLPSDLPFFFTADRPGTPPPGGLFADAAAFVRAAGAGVDEARLAALSGRIRIGSDGLCAIAVQSEAADGAAAGQVWAVSPQDGSDRRVNASPAAFARSLALLAGTRERMRGLDPAGAGAAIAEFQKQLAAIDPTALDGPETWWSVVVEQMWHGLF